ncbi:efflux RND transporter periplasmic adaptor subunit [Acinetobacter sp. DSM 11652]|uniref:efflux RND transporter periplasmic adaptor subunit n=1 Tax=Acinetobacter sp. DSM 11652 TaxID=346222 RepID=UPI0008C3B955|nr:efflux RND transporter periplasmic adaptor subunit [Acinetobacter sp. DSM 11652]SEL67097.1 membrane fusion protein, macrolide-specific efflux system [Acinetobacter sp. DSM 11652]
MHMQKKSKKLKYFLVLVVLVALALSVYFYIQSQKKQPEPQTVEVTQGDLTQIVKATGEIYASDIVSVGAQVSGQIQKLYIKLGQDVKKGELIAEIDSTTQLDKLNTSKAELEAAKADLAAKCVALQTLKQNYQRKLTLYKAEAGSREELEQANNQLKQAIADVESNEYRLKQLQINVNTAQTELGYTQIRSPLTGTVVSMPVEAGQTINFAQTTPLIATIANLNKMEIRMQVAEGDYTKLKENMPVKFSTLADPNVKLDGVIQSIDPALTTLTKGTYDDKNENANAAVFYYARMLVDNPERKLSIGMTTQNDIIVNQKKNVLKIPKTTVIGYGSDAMVYLYQSDAKPQPRKVVTGISDSNDIEIKAGLKLGEKILAEAPDDSANTSGDTQ